MRFRIISVTFHGVSFSGASLTIRENTNIITIQSTLNKLRKFIKDIDLFGFIIKNMLKVKFIFLNVVVTLQILFAIQLRGGSEEIEDTL